MAFIRNDLYRKWVQKWAENLNGSIPLSQTHTHHLANLLLFAIRAHPLHHSKCFIFKWTIPFDKRFINIWEWCPVVLGFQMANTTIQFWNFYETIFSSIFMRKTDWEKLKNGEMDLFSEWKQKQEEKPSINSRWVGVTRIYSYWIHWIWTKIAF